MEGGREARRSADFRTDAKIRASPTGNAAPGPAPPTVASEKTANPPATVRLQKYLSRAGVASRRRAEELIAAGRVHVNGRVVRQLGTSVEETDRVVVAGFGEAEPKPFRYVVMNKPLRVMTTMRDPEGRRTVASLLPKGGPRVVPVGRLDYDSSGVLLMTNDGDLAHVLTHPRFGVEKRYRAVVRGRLHPEDVRALLAGVRLEEGRTTPAKIRVVATSRTTSELDITIHEGRNRQVRRMLETTEHPVLSLVRLRFGPISLGALPAGATREATEREVRALRTIASEARRERDVSD
jgi:23S rRNA pseudouridine2605 synthase